MYITGINEIINVWANDANKVAVFIGLFFLPILIYLYYSQIKKAFIDGAGKAKSIWLLISICRIEVIFLLIILSSLIGFIGIGQVIIIIPLIDAIFRTIGIILYSFGIILSFCYYKIIKMCFTEKNKIHTLFDYVRYPNYTLILMIVTGISFLCLNFIGLILCIILLILLYIKILKEEKVILLKDKSFIDYKLDVPMFFPKIIKLIKIYSVEKIFKKK